MAKRKLKETDIFDDGSTTLPVSTKPKKRVGSRKVRIVPSPKKKSNIKIKKSQAKVNSAGQAIQNREGGLVTTLVDVEDALQIPGTVKTFKPGITKNGTLATGLDVLVDNPYHNEVVYYPEAFEKLLKGKPKALLQHLLEYKHKKEIGYYTNNVIDRINPSDKVSELPFFLTPQCQVPLKGGVMFLNLTNPQHEIWLYSLLASGEVANSYKELDMMPDASYYLVDDSEHLTVKTEQKRRMNVAISALEEVYTDGNGMVVKLAKALENSDSNIDADGAYTWLDGFFKQGEIQYAQFMKFYEMYKDVARRARFLAYAAVQEYMDKQIIRSRENRYYWIMPEAGDSPMRTFEWASKDRLVNDFILAPEYQDEVDILESLYKARV